MDVPTLFALGTAILSLGVASIALYFTIQTKRQFSALAKQPKEQKQTHFSDIANMLSDGSLVWQQLVVHCDELSAMLSSSNMQGTTRENIGDWLQQLREFSKNAKTEIDHAYQLFVTEAKSMNAQDLEMQLPDMEKFNKEMRSNVSVISDQLSHIESILQGHEPVGNRQFKITLHKPQVMPHFLRKRQKIAELLRRRHQPQPSEPAVQQS